MSDAPPSFSADDVISGQAQTRLRTLIERIERLEEDKAAILADVKEVYAEAKGEGFNVKILRRVVSLRKIDKVKRDEEETILDLYLTAVGDRLPMDLPIQHKPRPEKIIPKSAADTEAAIDSLVEAGGTSHINAEMLKLQMREARKWAAAHTPFRMREMAKAQHWPEETTKIIISALELEGSVSKADKSGLRRFNVLKDPDHKVTVSINGGPEMAWGSQEAAEAIRETITTKLARPARPRKGLLNPPPA